MEARVTRQDMVILYLYKYVNVTRNGYEMSVNDDLLTHMSEKKSSCDLSIIGRPSSRRPR